MRSLYRGVRGEYTEKKSRFIATLSYVETVSEAEEFFSRIRKEFYDARHNCTAFIINENGNIIKRSSDDGEPQGTAGHPMLDVLENEGLVNIAAVVTRYFGGTLLGTGGLVRSYTKAMQDAVEKSEFIERMQGITTKIVSDYQTAGKLDYYLAQNGYVPVGREYGENVDISLIVPEEGVPLLEKDINAISSGKSLITYGDKTEFAVLNGKVLLGNEMHPDEDQMVSGSG